MAASDYEVLDERFRACVNRTSHVERLWSGARWTEGPVYFPAGKYVLFSDIPNGLAVSADEKKLYIVDSAGGRNKGEPKHIRVFDVGEGGRLSGGKEFADCTAGRFDGMRFDTDGRLWAATDDGVHCLDSDGTLIGKVKIPEICSNVVFGGPKRNLLYITATNSLYGVMLHVNGHRTF